ncbi:hypothetical protein SAMN05428950_103354 [Sphingomonas sp. OV641]|uniref:hypothetical protein n=1 Tax=Sphingomonas sp. OV641 TaxID=1881068 RepID=UPI0008C46A0B|nr:hypothetical protein [Sphingomonas sp. OV641]SEJ82513.1 hypothetical protein SAMN05428950_103354 [Sphingomonas sp. OV641]
MRMPAIAAASLILTSCDSSAPQNVAAPAPAEPMTNQAAEVVALPEGQRNAVLLRAILDAGLPCQGVSSSEPLTTGGSTADWQARCTDGSTHIVQVKADGTAMVVSRATAR